MLERGTANELNCVEMVVFGCEAAEGDANPKQLSVIRDFSGFHALA
jgi:hypothetical protein